MQKSLFYQFKTESVIIQYNKQLIVFDSYSLQNKLPYVRFANYMRREKPQDINTIFKQAKRNNLKASSRVGTIIY